MAKSHEIDYKLYGDDMQFVEIELDPQETVIAEAGAMMFMEAGMEFQTRMGDGSKPESGLFGKLMSPGKGALTGEALFMTHFTNQGTGKSHVSFGAPYPGKIIPIDLDSTGGELICQKDSFLCAALGTEISIAFTRRLGAGFFGGEGFILQRLRGDGMVLSMQAEQLPNGNSMGINCESIPAASSLLNQPSITISSVQAI